MLNKGKIVNFGNTEKVLEVQGEAPTRHQYLTQHTKFGHQSPNTKTKKKVCVPASPLTNCKCVNYVRICACFEKFLHKYT